MPTLEELQKSYAETFGPDLTVLPDFRGESNWKVRIERLEELMRGLRRDGFDYLVDISTLDHFDEDPRFEVVYELFSYTDRHHLRVKSLIPDGDDPVVPSVVSIWPTANWHEREAFDMMGIRFEGHPDLRRILMWEGYPYYPLRKDFPLEGKPTEMPDIAFTRPAPLEGGPFVTSSESNAKDREPRARKVPANS